MSSVFGGSILKVFPHSVHLWFMLVPRLDWDVVEVCSGFFDAGE